MQNHPVSTALFSAETPHLALAQPHILCGTDFSEASAQAVEVAAAMARRAGEPLVLVHAVQDGAQENLPGELRESLCLYARAQLTEERERLRALQVQMVEAFRCGAPESVLLEEAAAHRARLLVLAAAKQRSPSGALLAGVPERVAEAAAAPTLVVRDAEPLLRWARDGRRLRVLVGADFSAPSEAALYWVQWLRNFGPCEVTVVYLESTVGLFPPGDVLPASLVNDMALKAAQMQQQHFRQRIKTILGPERVRTRFETGWGRSDAHLIQLAAEERADLIVVGTHSRRGWQRFGHHSVSRGVLRYAPLNVACVPTLEEPAQDIRELRQTSQTHEP